MKEKQGNLQPAEKQTERQQIDSKTKSATRLKDQNNN